MPMKINVGLSKKIGLPDYGSLGASCNVEFEADHSLLQNDLDAFQQRVRNAFVSCRQAVQEELAREQQTKTAMPASPAVQPAANNANAGSNGNGRSEPATSNGNGNGSHNGGTNGNGTSHHASPKQVEYLRQLAKQVPGLGIRRMEMLAERMFGKPLAVLSGFDASALIDTIKAVKAGQLDLDNVLGEGAPV